MTLAELERALASKHRTEKLRLKEKAVFDYKLADLIGRSIARIQSSAHRLPELAEAYPELFDGEEQEAMQHKKEAQKAELSVLRFKLFAMAHNEKYKKEAANN